MCRLLGGPTRDLNLMVRRGAGSASMRREPPATPSRWRGVFADGTLHWSDDPRQSIDNTTGWHLSA
jgi:environmental stress-induced protein Ves